MSKFLYIALFVLSCAVGFVITRDSSGPAAHALRTNPVMVSPEALANAIKAIRPIDLRKLESFFTAKGTRGILYVYRSDCAECDKQWVELAKIQSSLPLLAVSVDDSINALALGTATNKAAPDYVPYYVPPARVLTLRRWLRDRNCRFTGPLPFVAMTDGNGTCIMAWQGLTAHSAIDGVARYVAEKPTAP